MATTFLKTVDSLTNPVKKASKFVDSKEYQNNGKEREKSLKILVNFAESMKTDGQNNNKSLNKLQ